VQLPVTRERARPASRAPCQRCARPRQPRGRRAPGEPPRRARAAEEAEETGWKYIHGDVFRPPRHLSLFCACVGTGTQMLAMAACICALALAGVFFPYNRGALLTACVVRGAPRPAAPCPPARPRACLAPACSCWASRLAPAYPRSGALLSCSQGRPARPCARLSLAATRLAPAWAGRRACSRAAPGAVRADGGRGRVRVVPGLPYPNPAPRARCCTR